MSFNGGKMQHVLLPRHAVVDAKYDGDDDSALYSANAIENWQEIFENGEWFRKVDGSCGAIRRRNGRFEIYSRYDDKRNTYRDGIPDTVIQLPASAENAQTYESKSGTHRYYFVLCPRPEEGDKTKMAKMWRKLYDIVDSALPAEVEDDWIRTAELVGPHFNRTPGVSEDGIALHSEQKMDKPDVHFETLQEWFDWFQNFFSTECQEGIVIKHGNRFYKILSRGFAENRWSKDRNSARSPVQLKARVE